MSTSTLLVDEYEYKYIAKTWVRVHFHDYEYTLKKINNAVLQRYLLI